MKNLLLVFVCLFYSNFLLATHIIGGSMTYEDLGNDMYKVSLEVIKGCGAASFDDPAYIGIYSDGTYINHVSVNITGDIVQLSSNIPNSVCEFVNGACFEKYTYETTLNLPDVASGYDLSYQRCCRPEYIGNLTDPGSLGMTFHAHINTSIQNSSPVFNNNTPPGIFVATPFVHDASATDADGDSLVYSLVLPFKGGGIYGSNINPGNPNGPNGVQPIPPLGPPFTEIDFAEPYSIDNMLGGIYPLSIHPETGLMSAIPTTLGAYQIAYAVEEYRNGELIGITYREFVFGVAIPYSNQFFEISGSVFVNENISLDQGTVQLLQLNLNTGLLSVNAEQDIIEDEPYSFTIIPHGIFFVKAIVGENSIYAGEYLPTYHDSSALWYDAAPMNQCDTSSVYRDIYLIPINDSGDGERLFEGIVSQPNNNNQVVSNLDLILKNENDEFVQIQRTDASGYFKFEGLNDGDYFLYADLLNSNIYNNPPLLIELENDLNTNVYMYDTELSLLFISAVSNLQEEAIVNINPNPINNIANIEIDVIKGGIYTIEILDVYGKKIENIITDEYLTNGLFSKDISLLDYASGIYFISIQNDKSQMVEKIIKH